MNIIVTNQYKDLIEGTNIEIMKELNGVFKVSEIANSFNSIFYKKLIIDATALERFPKEDVLKYLYIDACCLCPKKVGNRLIHLMSSIRDIRYMLQIIFFA